MKLSIIIVNYNVKFFLEQCLHSVRNAIQNIDAEVYVVDNNSVDGSCAMLREKFPEVILIENKDNPGFSKANNQAVKVSKGEYVVLLNPDTLVEEDTFRKVIAFMDKTPDSGGVGVKMIDGNGNFLPESKRGLPTPMVAFYKIFGLSSLFPKSKTFGKYHLSYLNKDLIHEVDVLSGACMFLRKEALDKVGLLDETFFMYGEDIDLSYRITLGGYKNYYFPDTTIIHYKGESTKKGSINYVIVFYNAMIIFAKKHFSKKYASWFSFIIKTAVWFRAGLSILKRFLLSVLLPVIDIILIFLGYFYAVPIWERFKFPEGGAYPEFFMKFEVPAYVALWVASVFFTGGYFKPIKISKTVKGLTIGTIAILLIYSLLPEHLRFSRALIIFGFGWSLAVSVLSRYVLHLLKIESLNFKPTKKSKIVIVGLQDEIQRVNNIISQTKMKHELLGDVWPVSAKNENKNSGNYIGTMNQLSEIVKINQVDEVVFCAQNISSTHIIGKIMELSEMDVRFKIAPPESLSVIGSNSINTSGELYVVDIDSVARKINKRNKRIIDLFLSFNMLLFSPILILFVERKANFLKNILNVFKAKVTWVGYHPLHIDPNLPPLPKGVLSPIDIKSNVSTDIKFVEKINIAYAKNYKASNDLVIVLKSIRKLGNDCN